jgi:queuine tRNA-ribosyltransferase
MPGHHCFSLKAGCPCYTCTHFTKAYINHLFKAQELLAHTLVTIHNVRFMNRLMIAVRAALKSGPGGLKAIYHDWVNE